MFFYFYSWCFWGSVYEPFRQRFCSIDIHYMVFVFLDGQGYFAWGCLNLRAAMSLNALNNRLSIVAWRIAFSLSSSIIINYLQKTVWSKKINPPLLSSYPLLSSLFHCVLDVEEMFSTYIHLRILEPYPFKNIACNL